MRVVIAGGHGKIALLLERLLAGRGDQAVGLIRNPAHGADVQQAGAEAVVCDRETASAGDVAVLPSGTDAVVFAAGAGAGSGAPRKDSAAEDDLRSRDLDWTILRPGGLTDAPTTGQIRPAARQSPVARSPAPTSPRSSLPCSTSQAPGTRRLN